ncbi:nuclear transport factor 2 family protein [Aquibacillus rhizosphaerae]|uniref:DUF4440 domain-containing protein n=1 Tax=Aquibacillus rhizosphaerae TaxID=3051431 RepID=A0ABT7LAP3_9BACI|nr:DUF4440 domain-containing protein [Aquibacillus sp. LR5S19]MDL4842332.1 DUF4440 domain-containing protein [Aquibacillus sp. LR5S19]
MIIDEELKLRLKELEESHLKPEIRTSSQELEKLLADDFFEIGSSGNIYYKKDCVSDHGVEVRDMSIHDFETCGLSSDIILTTYKVIDVTREQETLRSSIWKFKDDRWQLFFHQGTVVKSN